MQPLQSIETGTPASHTAHQSSPAPSTPSMARKRTNGHSSPSRSVRFESNSENGSSSKKSRKPHSNNRIGLNLDGNSFLASALGPPPAPFPTPPAATRNVNPKEEHSSPNGSNLDGESVPPPPQVSPSSRLQLVMPQLALLAADLDAQQRHYDHRLEQAEIDRQVLEQFLDAEKDKTAELSREVGRLKEEVRVVEAKAEAARVAAEERVAELEHKLTVARGELESKREALDKAAGQMRAILAGIDGARV